MKVEKPYLDLELALGHTVRAIWPHLVVGIRGRAAAEPPLHHPRSSINDSTPPDQQVKSNQDALKWQHHLRVRWSTQRGFQQPFDLLPGLIQETPRSLKRTSRITRNGAGAEPIPPRTCLPACLPPEPKDGSWDRRRRRRGG